MGFRAALPRGKGLDRSPAHVVSRAFIFASWICSARSAPRDHARARQFRAGDRAIRRAGPVRPHHRCLFRRAAAGTGRRRAALVPLIGAWVGFGLFIIVAAALVAASPTGWRTGAGTR